jgi:hypothetical protein
MDLLDERMRGECMSETGKDDQLEAEDWGAS